MGKTGLTANEFQKRAMRTKPSYQNEGDQLINAALGLCGESGEFADLLKKFLYQGHKIYLDDIARRMEEELGDILWYAALAADAMGLTMEVVMTKNIDKLLERYPNGFEVEKSRNREERR